MLLWVAMSAAYCVEFFMSYWLPTLLMQDGDKVASAGLVLAIGKVGSFVGALAVGWTIKTAQAKRGAYMRSVPQDSPRVCGRKILPHTPRITHSPQRHHSLVLVIRSLN